MIGFGELRRRASEWKQDISDVERLYATDWLLKYVFDSAVLAQQFALRGASALRFAYAPAYSLDESPELVLRQDGPAGQSFSDPAALRAALEGAVRPGESLGPKLSLADFSPSVASFEYVGPLGRRSAAQPHIRLSIIPGALQHVPARVPLIHRFTDACAGTVVAVALEELLAEYMVALARPAVRARDVYDLWFVATELRAQIDLGEVKALVESLARAKNIELPAKLTLASSARQSLERTWDTALRRVPNRPLFDQVERELNQLSDILA